jgi:hypothetical protein
VLGVGAERAEASRQMGLAVLQPPQVDSEPCEVAAGRAKMALGLVPAAEPHPSSSADRAAHQRAQKPA